jgi:hypothetical protein
VKNETTLEKKVGSFDKALYFFPAEALFLLIAALITLASK